MIHDFIAIIFDNFEKSAANRLFFFCLCYLRTRTLRTCSALAGVSTWPTSRASTEKSPPGINAFLQHPNNWYRYLAHSFQHSDDDEKRKIVSGRDGTQQGENRRHQHSYPVDQFSAE
jgi:hypothetical protein